jgi:tetratricopeptide (TPR) repeat protein
MGKKQRMEEEKGQVITFHQSGHYFYEKGMKAYRRNNLEEAIKYLKRAAHTEKDPFMLCQLGSALSEAGQYHESNQIFNHVLRMDDAITECYYYMANNYAFLGLFQQAKKYAERYLKAEEDGEFTEEILDLLDIIAIEEDDEEEFEDEDELIVMQEQANSLIRSGRLDEAIATLETVLTEYPEFWSAYNNLAIARFQLGEIEEALRIVDMVLEKNPGNLHALCNSLIFLYSIGQEEQAENLADQLEHVYPILVEHRFKLGTTLATVGRFETAYKWLKTLKRQGYEGDVSFYYWFAYSAYMSGDTYTAEKMWKRVVDFYPDKEGKEPWNHIHFTGENQEALLGQLRVSFAEAQSYEEQMLALYLMNELQTSDKMQVLFDILQSAQNPVVAGWARYFFLLSSGKKVPKELKEFERCAQIANVLYSHTKKDDELIEECLQCWFRTFLSFQHTNTSFTNAFGWSAAVEYVVRNEQKENMTQAEIGNIYNVSVSTVRKYVQAVKRGCK